MPSNVIEFLMDQEGFFEKPEKDTRGFRTLGFGRNLDTKGLDPVEEDFLIEQAFLRGIEDGDFTKGITKEVGGLRLLQNDITDSAVDLQTIIPQFDKLDDARQAALISMRMNLGPGRFRGFDDMIRHVNAGNIPKVVEEFFNSVRAGNVPDPKTGIKKKQVAPRRLAAEAYMLETGRFPKGDGTELIPRYKEFLSD